MKRNCAVFILVAEVMAVSQSLSVGKEQLRQLVAIAQDPSHPRAVYDRILLIWLLHQGLSYTKVSAQVGLNPKTINYWVKRFQTLGPTGLLSRPRPGSKPRYDAAVKEYIMQVVQTSPQTYGLSSYYWTYESLARYLKSQGIMLGRSALQVYVAQEMRKRPLNVYVKTARVYRAAS